MQTSLFCECVDTHDTAHFAVVAIKDQLRQRGLALDETAESDLKFKIADLLGSFDLKVHVA
jgi:hypothetical protein